VCPTRSRNNDMTLSTFGSAGAPVCAGCEARRHSAPPSARIGALLLARFVARNHINAFLQFSSNARPNPLDQLQKLLPFAGLQRVASRLHRIYRKC
jgi:hypothetical protein